MVDLHVRTDLSLRCPSCLWSRRACHPSAVRASVRTSLWRARSHFPHRCSGSQEHFGRVGLRGGSRAGVRSRNVSELTRPLALGSALVPRSSGPWSAVRCVDWRAARRCRPCTPPVGSVDAARALHQDAARRKRAYHRTQRTLPMGPSSGLPRIAPLPQRNRARLGKCGNSDRVSRRHGGGVQLPHQSRRRDARRRTWSPLCRVPPARQGAAAGRSLPASSEPLAARRLTHACSWRARPFQWTVEFGTPEPIARS